MPTQRTDQPHYGPTATLRVSEQLAAVLDEECRPRGAAAVLAPWLEPWIAEEFRRVGDEVHRLGRDGEGNRRRERVPARAARTIRLPLWQLRRLGIISEVRDRWMGEMVEEKLWEWVRDYGVSELARAALSKRGGWEKVADPGERVYAGAGDGR